MPRDYTRVADKLKGLGDPFASNLDPQQIQGFGFGYTPVTTEDTSFDVPLSGYEKRNARQASLTADVLSTLAETPNLTEDEKQLLEQYHNPKLEFFIPDWKVNAQWRGKYWMVFATSDDGEHKSFRAHVARDKDSIMSHCISILGQPKKLWRELDESELLEIARMAPGSPESAIYTYINRALPGIDEDISFNPAYQEICNEIIWFVVENHFPEFDQDAAQFMAAKLGNRPLTWNMARELFMMWKEQKFASRRSSLFNPPVPKELTAEEIQQGLDDLSDAQLEALRRDTESAFRGSLR